MSLHVYTRWKFDFIAKRTEIRNLLPKHLLKNFKTFKSLHKDYVQNKLNKRTSTVKKRKRRRSHKIDNRKNEEIKKY